MSTDTVGVNSTPAASTRSNIGGNKPKRRGVIRREEKVRVAEYFDTLREEFPDLGKAEIVKKVITTTDVSSASVLRILRERKKFGTLSSPKKAKKRSPQRGKHSAFSGKEKEAVLSAFQYSQQIKPDKPRPYHVKQAAEITKCKLRSVRKILAEHESSGKLESHKPLGPAKGSTQSKPRNSPCNNTFLRDVLRGLMHDFFSKE